MKDEFLAWSNKFAFKSDGETNRPYGSNQRRLQGDWLESNPRGASGTQEPST